MRLLLLDGAGAGDGDGAGAGDGAVAEGDDVLDLGTGGVLVAVVVSCWYN